MSWDIPRILPLLSVLVARAAWRIGFCMVSLGRLWEMGGWMSSCSLELEVPIVIRWSRFGAVVKEEDSWTDHWNGIEREGDKQANYGFFAETIERLRE